MQDDAGMHEEVVQTPDAQTESATPPGGQPPQKPPATNESGGGAEEARKIVSDFIAFLAGLGPKEKRQLQVELHRAADEHGKSRVGQILSNEEISSLMAGLEKGELVPDMEPWTDEPHKPTEIMPSSATRESRAEDAKDKAGAVFFATSLTLDRARNRLNNALCKESSTLAQVRLVDHIRTIDTLFRQDSRAEPYSFGEGIADKAKELEIACESGDWPTVEHYLDVFKTVFRI